MAGSDSISYIAHEAPVWRAANSHLAMVDLAPFGFERANEQIWLKRVNDSTYEVCCIPFRVYGLALGDQVVLYEDKFIARVVDKSGRRVFRVFFTMPRTGDEVADSRSRLFEAIRAEGLLNEWSGDRHVAVDVPREVNMQSIFDSVADDIQNGLAFWEWADSEPFRSTYGE